MMLEANDLIFTANRTEETLERATSTEYYFAYGSNINERQMRFRISSAKFFGVAILRDYQISLVQPRPYWGGAVVGAVSSLGSRIEGTLYEINQLDFKTLDFYQGVFAGEAKRVRVSVYQSEAVPIEAWTYFLTQVRGVGLVPSSYYAQRLLAGAIERELSEDYIEELKELLLSSEKDEPSNGFRKQIDPIT
jgi:gamma-glutamylcyclotransferase (GGCT)/AIG2-like uncharacterized protein YtfP